MLTMLATLALAQPTPPAIPDGIALPEVPEAPAAPDGLQLPEIPAFPAIPALPVRLSSAAATRDLFELNETVEINETVADNAFVMAQRVDVNAPIGGDVFTMGQTVVIDKAVAGDVYVMAKTITITENGSIGGNLNVFAGELDLRGPVGGDVHAQVGEAYLADAIGGNLSLSTARLTIESTAAIAGDLDYTSPDPYPALESAAAGKVTHTLEEVDADVNFEINMDEENDSSILAQATWWAGMRGWGFLTKFLVGSLLFFLGGQWLAAAGHRVGSHPAHSLGTGFVTAGVIPLFSCLALVMVVPFPLGLLGFTLLGVLLYLGQLFAAQALGDFLLHRLRPHAVGNPYISLAVGLVPMMLLFALPYLGTLAWLTATLLGIGGLVSALRGIR